MSQPSLQKKNSERAIERCYRFFLALVLALLKVISLGDKFQTHRGFYETEGRGAFEKLFSHRNDKTEEQEAFKPA